MSAAFDQFEERKIDLALIIQAIFTQARVINALVLRETKTRYGNYKIGFLWALLEPAISVTIFTVIFTAIRNDEPSGMPLVTFMIVGFVSYSMFRDPWTKMQSSISQSRHLLTFPQVTTYDVILAKGLLDIIVTLFVMGLLLFIAYILGFEVRVERPLGVLAVLGLLAIGSLGMGFFFASLEPMIPSIKQLSSTILGRPMYFGSGLFFTAESVPEPFLKYLLYNPILHMIELVRSEFHHGFETQHGSWLYASSWSVGLLALGLVTHQALRKRAIVAK